MNKQLIEQAQRAENIKYIFFDYYDTVVHRKVHPLEPFRIWAKLLKRKLGLGISSIDIYKIRKNSMSFLSDKTGLAESELGYEVVMREVYNRLVNSGEIKSQTPFSEFLTFCIEYDYQSESGVQYLNRKTVATVQSLKEEGYKIYCVSDFHSDEDLMSQLMKFHGIDHLYDKIFVSAAQNASKENRGVLFEKIMEKEGIFPKEILMVGDNPISDVANAQLHGIEAYYLKRYRYKVRQKYLFLIFRMSNWLGELKIKGIF